jgi:hypothetical protein
VRSGAFAEEIEKVERGNAREAEKKKQQGDKAKAKRSSGESGAGEDGDADLGVGVFLRACEFVAPRRERFSERDAIVFDFRPRPGFKPSNNSESLVAKLAGIVWIDPIDKQVMRLEARLTDGFKIGGGLVARVRPGSAFVIEQTRLADGVWLPRFSQINASAKVFPTRGLSPRCRARIRRLQTFRDGSERLRTERTVNKMLDVRCQ